MKLEFSIDKCWGECVRPATMDDVRMAKLEILSFLPGEVNFFLYPNNRDSTLWVENNLMVHFSDEVGTSKICSAEVASFTALEQVCQLYLMEKYEKVYASLNGNKMVCKSDQFCSD